MPRPKADDLKDLLAGIAAEAGLTVAEICLKGQTTGKPLHARRRFMKAARALGARNNVIAAALGDAVTPARVSQICGGVDPDLTTEARVRAMLAAVAAETGLQLAEITDSGRQGDHAVARRLVMQRADAIGAAYALIARVLGVQYQSVSKMLARHADLARQMPADPLAPFRRRQEWVPLLVSDYCLRGRVSEDVARIVLDELRVTRRVTCVVERVSNNESRIYEVAPEHRKAAAA